MHPIDLFFWMTPNGYKITIMLEECGLPYRVKPVNFSRSDQHLPQFRAISPNGKMPAIIDLDGPDGEPIAIFESGAILQYLGRKASLFYPQAARARAEVEQWLFWQVGGLGPMAGQANHFRRMQDPIPYAVERYTSEVARLYRVMDDHLAGRPFLAGELSIADFATVGWVKYADMQGLEVGDYPNVKRWFDALLARPAVQRGFAVTIDRAETLAADEAFRAQGI
jgi:GST-like protein